MKWKYFLYSEQSYVTQWLLILHDHLEMLSLQKFHLAWVKHHILT